jgi:Zn-dependent protease with chaperone function
MGMDTHNTEVPWKTLGLYALTLAFEFPVVVWRGFILLLITGIITLIHGGHNDNLGSFLLLAYLPAVWSLVALNRTFGDFGSGWWWRSRVGGREPSTREHQAYEDAIRTVRAHAGNRPLVLPKEWFVIDLPEPEAAVCGHTLMLSHTVLESPYLPAVIAHELGHLATWDARVTLAINRLVLHPLREPRPDEERYRQTNDPATQFIGLLAIATSFAKAAFRWCRGGLGIWLLRPAWGHVWRDSEYAADRYAASLGFADELADALETNALAYDQPVPFSWLSAETHPPTELRLDRLRAYANNTNPAPTSSAPPVDLARPATPIQEELPGLEGATT